jgi:hypothetical protein
MHHPVTQVISSIRSSSSSASQREPIISEERKSLSKGESSEPSKSKSTKRIWYVTREERRSEEKASPEKRRPEAQALRERRAARPSPKETAERRRAEPPLREKSMKGTARGAASLGEGASEAHFA